MLRQQAGKIKRLAKEIWKNDMATVSILASASILIYYGPGNEIKHILCLKNKLVECKTVKKLKGT
jgi:hypothetical protein